MRLAETEGLERKRRAGEIAIAEGQVKVDGAVETRKRCKIVAGQTVSFAGHPAYRLLPDPFPGLYQQAGSLSDFCPLRPVHPC